MTRIPQSSRQIWSSAERLPIWSGRSARAVRRLGSRHIAAGSGTSPGPKKAPPLSSPTRNEAETFGDPLPVVLIEDNKTDVFLVREAIQLHRLRVRLQVIEDGEQALAYVDALDRDAGASAPRLFLLDLNLPRRSGCEVLAHIRQSRKCAHVPVVIVTSSDLESDRAESASLGATDYFRKPAGYEAFLKIGEVIGRLLAV